MKPPRPPARPTLLPSPFGDRTDPYYWLRDDSRQSPELLEHLAAENAYYKAVMAPFQQLEDEIYAEILGRIQQDDDSVPWRYRGWWYWSRYEKGKEHPIYYRRRDQDGSPEELLLDMNQRAEGQSYCALGGWAPSPDGQRLVFLEDTVGRRQHVLWVKDLNTGKILEDQIPGCSGSVAWLDDQTLLYVRNDPETLRSCEVLLHRLGTDLKEDRLLHREDDEAFYVGVGTTADESYALIHLGSTVTSEVLVAPLGPDPVFRPFWPRERDHEYHLEHLDGHWIIRSNKGSLNFRILRQADGAEQPEEWVAHRDDVFVEQIMPLRDWLVIGERADALRRIRLLRWDRSEDRIIASDEAAYTAWIGHNPDPDSPTLRYHYGSLTTPETVYDLVLATGERILRKRQAVLGGYDPAVYVTERRYATAPDGRNVPISLVRRRDTAVDGRAPLLLYGYGAYGYSLDPTFSAARLSLLDRGFVYAMAHVRGGQECGRLWYEEGRTTNKRNSFTDFIAAADALAEQGVCDPRRIVAMGGSAGGLLVAAAMNLRPDRFCAVVAQVPFVDALTTMMDDRLPLTTGEYDEWGNPAEEVAFHNIRSWSPMDNVQDAAFPAVLATTGLWDSQVQYFEPAKWVVRLRDHNLSEAPILLRVELEAGHGGKSGRYQRYREVAQEYAFVVAFSSRSEGGA